MRKTVSVVIAALIFIILLFSNTALAETRDIEKNSVLIITGQNDEGISNKKAAEQYIYKNMNWTNKYTKPAAKFRGTSAGDRLSGKEAWLYLALKEVISDVAAGNRSSTEFIFPLFQVFDDIAYSAQELNVSDLNSPEAETAFLEKIYEFISGAMDALLYDCPYELYWHDKTAGHGISAALTVGEDNKLHFADYNTGEVTIFYIVASAYSVTGDSNTCEFDTEKGQAIQSAVVHAQQIVNNNASLTDYYKLKAYKNAICGLTDYNFAALEDDTLYGDAWQLIYVFDGDPNTKVVCEGYAKAFQYLCDVSTFNDAYTITVTGIMVGGTGAGRHMWNNVALNGVHYLADITNSDAGSIGDNGALFLAGYTERNEQDNRIWYHYAVDGCGYVSYSYDDETISVFGNESSELDLSDSSYSPVTSGQVVLDGIIYDLYENEAIVVGYTEISSVLNIPGEIQGRPVTTIAEGAFHGCNIITEVNIPNTVRSMTGSYKSTRVSSEYVPVVGGGSLYTSQTIYYISGRGAFSECVNLATINFSENSQLENIGPFSFAYTAVTEVELPSNVLNVDAGAFYGCPYLLTVSLNAKLRSIGMSAFSIAQEQREFPIDLPKTSSLRNVHFSGSIEYIGVCAFQDTKLTAVTLPEGLKSIGDFAFFYTQLISIDIPSTVEYIGTGALVTDYMTSITVSDTNKHFSSIEGVLFTKDQKVLISCPRRKTGDYHIPDSVKKIEENAFWHTMLSSCTLPDSICELGKLCFYYSDAQIINIPNGITRIPPGAFEGCKMEDNLVLPDSILYIENEAFSETDLESIVFGQNTKSIGDYAFRNSKVRSVTIPDSIEYIGDSAFANSEVTQVIISENVLNSIDINNVFYNTPYLGKTGQCGDSITYYIRENTLVIMGNGLMWDYTGWDSPFNNTEVENVVIGEEIMYIGDAAFVNMKNITELTFPENVLAVGESIISACPEMAKVTFLNPQCIIPSDSLPDYVTIYGYDNSTAQEYANTEGNAFVSLGNYQGEENEMQIISGELDLSSVQWRFKNYILTFTGEGAIDMEKENLSANDFPWHSLKPFVKTIIIGEGITSIGDHAFDGFTQLLSITFPRSLVSIGEWAFNNCVRVSGIAFPESLEHVGSYAFRYCKKIRSIDIPDSLTDIGNGVFAFCNELEVFSLPNSLSSIPDGMFSNCGIKQLVLPEGIITIGEGAFVSCSELSSIKLPASITSIGNSAFSESSITEIVIPSSVNSIEEYTFCDCHNLQRIILPANLSIIKEGAFYECTSLHSITIPASVQFIDQQAFLRCTNLTTYNIPGENTALGPFSCGYSCERGEEDFYLIAGCTIYCRQNSSAEEYAINNGIDYILVGEENEFWEEPIYIWATDNSTVTAMHISPFSSEYVETETVAVMASVDSPTEEEEGSVTYVSDEFSKAGFERQTKILMIPALKDMSVIYLPAVLREIGNEAFVNLSCEAIIIPNTCISVGNRAFQDCKKLRYIRIPLSLDIPADVFAGCNNIVIDRGSN